MEWPEMKSQYLTTKDFQDKKVTLTFIGWERKANEDDPTSKKNAKTWKEKLKFQLRYSYPKFALDEAGEQMLGKDGQPFQNANYLEEFPKGYSIIYKFKEGNLETGSYPLFKHFCRLRPKTGDILEITKTGESKETVWSVNFKDIQTGIPGKDEFGADQDVPF